MGQQRRALVDAAPLDFAGVPWRADTRADCTSSRTDTRDNISGPRKAAPAGKWLSSSQSDQLPSRCATTRREWSHRSQSETGHSTKRHKNMILIRISFVFTWIWLPCLPPWTSCAPCRCRCRRRHDDDPHARPSIDRRGSSPEAASAWWPPVPYGRDRDACSHDRARAWNDLSVLPRIRHEYIYIYIYMMSHDFWQHPRRLLTNSGCAVMCVWIHLASCFSCSVRSLGFTELRRKSNVIRKFSQGVCDERACSTALPCWRLKFQ